jgi:hypothetical protein
MLLILLMKSQAMNISIFLLFSRATQLVIITSNSKTLPLGEHNQLPVEHIITVFQSSASLFGLPRPVHILSSRFATSVHKLGEIFSSAHILTQITTGKSEGISRSPF